MCNPPPANLKDKLTANPISMTSLTDLVKTTGSDIAGAVKPVVNDAVDLSKKLNPVTITPTLLDNAMGSPLQNLTGGMGPALEKAGNTISSMIGTTGYNPSSPPVKTSGNTTTSGSNPVTGTVTAAPVANPSATLDANPMLAALQQKLAKQMSGGRASTVLTGTEGASNSLMAQ